MAHFRFALSGHNMDIIGSSKGISDTININTAVFEFRSAEWDGLSKWAHFSCPSYSEGESWDYNLVDDEIPAEAGFNLPCGTWAVHVTGIEVDAGGTPEVRMVSYPVNIQIIQSGVIGGEPIGTIEPSVAEQIDAKATAALQARITSATAEIDNTFGVPDVSVELTGAESGKCLEFVFQHLKGNGIEEYEFQEDGTIYVLFSDGTEQTYEGVKNALAALDEKLEDLDDLVAIVTANEQLRVTAEQARQTAETARQSAEAVRTTNDATRSAEWESRKTQISSAITSANSAADRANAASASASEAYGLALAAVERANTAADSAEGAATLANTKAGLANTAAASANTAAGIATTKAGLADAAATAANTAAGSANTAASAANTAAGSATTAASSANSAASVATTAAAEASNAADAALDATEDANDAADAANEAADRAELVYEKLAIIGFSVAANGHVIAYNVDNLDDISFQLDLISGHMEVVYG